MAFEQKDMSGVLFKNRRKESEKHPDTTGNCLIDDLLSVAHCAKSSLVLDMSMAFSREACLALSAWMWSTVLTATLRAGCGRQTVTLPRQQVTPNRPSSTTADRTTQVAGADLVRDADDVVDFRRRQQRKGRAHQRRHGGERFRQRAIRRRGRETFRIFLGDEAGRQLARAEARVLHDRRDEIDIVAQPFELEADKLADIHDLLGPQHLEIRNDDRVQTLAGRRTGCLGCLGCRGRRR